MSGYDHLIRLVVAIGLVLMGLVLTGIVSIVIMVSAGMSLTELMEMGQQSITDFTPGQTRLLLATQHLGTFVLPGLLFGVIYYRPRILHGMNLGINPGLPLAFFGILFLVAAYPLVNLSFLLNEAIPLPSWAISFEDQAADTLKAILAMDTFTIFLINLFLIAILPGIGEELIFRGILQKHIGGIIRNPIVAIWIAAFLFSAIHLQFEGFFPRMVLGVVLGYLYYWTRNLWIPIIAHAFNNGIQVILIYAADVDLETFDEQSSNQLQWWMLPISIGFMYLIYHTIIKQRHKIEEI